MNDHRDKLKGGIDQAADTAKSTTDWVADKAGDVKDGAVNLAETVEDRAKKMANAFADRANRAGHKAGEWIADAAQPVQEFAEKQFEHGKQAMESFGREATDMIRRYPITSVAICLGLGVLLGRAVSGSRV